MSAPPGPNSTGDEKAPSKPEPTLAGHTVGSDPRPVTGTPPSDASIHGPASDEKPRPSSHSGDVPELAHSDWEDEGTASGDPELGGEPAGTALSRTSSARSRAVTIVPMGQRRGLLARLAVLVPEVERPYEYSQKHKWTITTIVALAGSASPLGSSIFYPALGQMAVDLKTTETITNLTVAVYMLSMSIFPLWWSSFSETLGRRTIYVVSFALFVVASVLSALSTNIAMLIVMRVLGGGASASAQAVGAGTIADIWEPKNRGSAMGIFYLGPLLGPLLAPIFGGALSQRWGWQSTMWFLVIYGGLVWVMIVFCLPETLAKKRRPAAEPETAASLRRTSTRQSVSQHTKATARFLKRAFVDPLSVLLYLRFMPVALTVMYAAVTFGALFILNISVQSTFARPPYGYPELVLGLLYLPASVGYIVGSLAGGRWIDRIMAREARRAGRFDAAGNLVLLPEDRMRENAWLAAVLCPASLVWFGWTAAFGAHVAAPSVANFFFGFASMLVFGAATTMLTEFMPSRSSAGVAVNNFVRNIFSCVGTVVAQPLLNVMGVGWLCTAVAVLTFVVGAVAVWSLGRYSSKWRIEMDKKLKEG
ncbi:quinidine resistance [Gaeumannomyces tritici R3-111a-1]|uniref:Quinidine resistance n=1 Tax=Gaeumannomyces tritici (strain R3-111a-1) TaxID=644352 RepID=J3P020_GAET3|nr:quinidine resistance [Gaeumannomyces tritici R3-111a-1]EJT76953.1 quinidine resistance [Gaeumannomyces tritici R3-111a-1]